MLEKDLENILIEEVKKLGGYCLKIDPTKLKGFPDRMIILPHKIISFVELKRPGSYERPSEIQAWWIRKLREMGHQVDVIDSEEKLKLHIKTLRTYMGRRNHDGL